MAFTAGGAATERANQPPQPQPGADGQPAKGPDPESQAKRPKHVDVHGLYLTGYSAGNPEKLKEIVSYMESSGLNAMVVDAKDDDGSISWHTEISLAAEIGSNGDKIRDPAELVRYLHDHHIYAIARIVVYADPLLGKRRPDMAILHGDFADRRGIHWPDPYNQSVWRYNIDIAKSAAQAGFDEIQFDYIRFPEIRIDGYNKGVSVQRRTDAIEGFLRQAASELHPLGVFVAADVFGLTTSVEPGDDMEIGQDYVHLAAIVDYLLPMVYPSHFAKGTYGIPEPDTDPGRTVYEALVRAQQRTWGTSVQKHRPWIQDFSLQHTYRAAEVEAQIRGLARAGIHQWVLWDPNNRYSRDANYNVAPPSDREPEWMAEYRQELLRANPPPPPHHPLLSEE